MALWCRAVLFLRTVVQCGQPYGKNTTASRSVESQLQTAIRDLDPQYSVPNSGAHSSMTTDDSFRATGVRGNFVRAKVIAISGGSGVTVQIFG